MERLGMKYASNFMYDNKIPSSSFQIKRDGIIGVTLHEVYGSLLPNANIREKGFVIITSLCCNTNQNSK